MTNALQSSFYTDPFLHETTSFPRGMKQWDFYLPSPHFYAPTIFPQLPPIASGFRDRRTLRISLQFPPRLVRCLDVEHR